MSEARSEITEGGTATEEELRAASVAELEALVKSGNQEHFLELLAAHLDREMSTRTFFELVDAAWPYLTIRGISFLTVAANEPGAERAEMFESSGLTGTALTLANRVIGLYGSRLSQAQALSTSRSADDWRRYDDVTTTDEDGRILHTVRIEKANGEEVTIAGVPDSIGRLAGNLLSTLTEAELGSLSERVAAFLQTSFAGVVAQHRLDEDAAAAPAADAIAEPSDDAPAEAS
jgi:hypothetical protein